MSSVQDLNQLSGIDKLKRIMARLRSEDGCPWDREQTHISLKKYLLEETYEVLQAIDESNMYNLREELGDLLLQVVFNAQIAEEEGEFTLEDIIDNLNEKLLRRHPHVFNDRAQEQPEQDCFGVDDVNKAWEQIKLREKKERLRGAKTEHDAEHKTEHELEHETEHELEHETEHETEDESLYLQTPKGLPALMEAEFTQRKASQWGFDWQDKSGPWTKVYEELAELEQAIEQGSEQELNEEMGDLLFSLVNVSRFIGVDPDSSLRSSTTKFRKRFTNMMKYMNDSGKKIENISLEDFDKVWNLVKRRK